jgi:hypothetical protein
MLSVKSPCFHLVLGLLFTFYPLFQWYQWSKEFFIKSQYEMLKAQHLMHKVRE